MPDLEQDPELIERLALLHEGNATSHILRAVEDRTTADAPRAGWSQHQMLAASSFALAGSCWSLIAPRLAVQRYRRAAELYRAMGHSYWMVLALASAGESDVVTVSSGSDETSSLSAQAVAFAMVGNEVAGEDRDHVRAEQLDAQWRHFGNVPLGRLGISLDHYARLGRAIRTARAEQRIERFFGDAGAYVRRAAEVLHSASHDRFHWQRLQSTVLPAEPEAVAMTRVLSMISHEVFARPVSEMEDLDAHGRRLVEIGDEMRDAVRAQDDAPLAEPEVE